MLSKNFKTVENRIQSACEKAKRNRGDIKLLLASKTVSSERLKECLDLGYSYFAENRVQEFQKKSQDLKDYKIQWDFIGHLQTNKVKDLIGKVNLIHSVDRPSLVKEISKRAAKPQKILIEVNTSREKEKSGVLKEDLSRVLNQVLESPNIEFHGLMTVAINTNIEAEVRRCFQELYELREHASKESGIVVRDLELSMGMSGDFEWAIKEGATIIRLGSLVFGERS